MGLLSSITSEIPAGAMQMPTMPTMPKPPQAPKAPQMPGMPPGTTGQGSDQPDSSLEPTAAVGIARWLNIGAILLVIAVITVGVAQQVGYGMPPSELGVLERTALFAACAAPILNLLRGMRPQHYAFALFAALVGGFASVREFLGHVSGQLALDPNELVFGRPLFEWAFAVFAVIIIGVGVMLIWTKTWLALDFGLIQHFGPSRTWAFASIIWLMTYVVFTMIQVPVQCGGWSCPADPTSSGNPGWQFTFAITNDQGADASISIPGFVTVMIGIGLLSLIIGAVMNHRMISQKDGAASTGAVPASSSAP